MIAFSMKSGLQRGWQLKRILAIFWLGNLLIAALFLRPYTRSFYQFFKYRLVTDQLARQNLYTYFAEFYHYMKPAVETARLTLNLGGLLFFVLTILLSGGLVYYLLNREEVQLRTFWSQCGYFLGRMSRLVLLSVLLFLTVVLLSGIVFALIFWILPEHSPENQMFWAAVLGAVFTLFFLILYFIVLDLSKVYLVRNDSPVVPAFRHALRLFGKQFGKLLVTYALFYLLSAALFGFSFWLHSQVPGNSGWQIAVGFALTQIFLVLQFWFKFARIGALVVYTQNAE